LVEKPASRQLKALRLRDEPLLFDLRISKDDD
jgi:hypothetical protein